MTATAIPQAIEPSDTPAEKGLKGGALGLVSSVVMGVASTAPAYSLAATLFFVVAVVGVQAPIVAVVAFVPMLLISIGYKEMNNADPDCGTTFTWATRAFGPKTGWWGGWGIVAADVLVMASLAQVAAQYMFLLVGANEGSTTVHGHTTTNLLQHFYLIGHNPSSGWVLLLGVLWIVAMTYICYRGIEVSAAIQRALLSIELTMLLVLSIVALVKVGSGHAPAGHISPALSWLNPLDIPSFSSFVSGFILMLFIYWGWDTAVSVNEETANAKVTPGRAAVISTLLLLVTYALVIFAAQSFAGVGSTGVGLGNSSNQSDVLSVLGSSVFGSSGFGTFLARLLVLMVLSSAAASTQTTILPTARTTLSMAVYRAIPRSFSRMHKRYLTPTVSTLVMGGVSIALYAWFNYQSPNANVIPDAVTALGTWIAFYYGMTGVACAWYYRKTLRQSARNLWMRGILPLVGAMILFAALVYSVISDWKIANSYTQWHMSFWPHWDMGGVFVIAVGSAIVGAVLLYITRIFMPDFFKGKTLNKATPTLVSEEGLPLVPVAVVGAGAAPAEDR